MGMYTELVLKCELKSEVNNNDKILNIFKYLFLDSFIEISDLPDHEFFKCDRWRLIGNCCSYYHIPNIIKQMWFDSNGNTWYIFSRSDLKNYNDEINKFVNWASKYINPCVNGSNIIGWKWYEEAKEPTFLKLGENLEYDY